MSIFKNAISAGMVLAFSLAGASIALAQTSLQCSDFQHNRDGSWSPLRQITLNGISFGPGVAFREGVAFGGVDLARILNNQCR